MRFFRPRTACVTAADPLDCQVRRARRGTRPKQSRRAVRGGPQGPRSESQAILWTKPQPARRIFLDRRPRAPVLFLPAHALGRIGAMHFPLPSVDQGVMAFVWALLLAVYVYFGLLAVGSSGAFAIVIALLAFAGIWFFVRLRGEGRPRS